MQRVMDFDQLRDQIPVCSQMAYMNTGWSGPSPITVVSAIKERLDYEMEMGPTSPEVYDSGLRIQASTKDAVARLLNATPEEICLTDNTTHGLNIVVNGLPWRNGDEIITFDLEHSSVLIPSYYLQRRHGVLVKVLKIAPDEEQEIIVGKLEAALTDRTRLVFLSHIQYSCGLRMPVEEIRKLTADPGILMLVDGAQSAGHIPLDMRAIGCEFYSIAGHKWLLGSEGVGALFVRKDLISRLEPTQVASHAAYPMEDPYRFEPETSSIDKFLLTSTSTPLYAGLLEAIGFIQGIGVERIEARNLDLAVSLKTALQETSGVNLLSPLEGPRTSGLVSFTIDGIDPKAAVSYLWKQHRIVARSLDYPSCVRVSLHFFNTKEEINHVVEAVRRLAMGTPPES